MAVAPTGPDAGLSPWLQALGINLGRLLGGGLMREYKSKYRECASTPNLTKAFSNLTIGVLRLSETPPCRALQWSCAWGPRGVLGAGPVLHARGNPVRGYFAS